MTQFFQLLFTGILLGGVYGLVALSIVLIYKSTKVINLAQGSILVICAFIAWTFMVPVGLPVWFSIVLAIMCGAVLGVLIERLAMRPLIGQPVLSAVIVTLTIGFFIEGVTLIAWPGVMEVFPHFIPISPVKLGELAFSQHYVWSFGTALLVFITLALFFRYTKQGLAMRAVAEITPVARSVGINVGNVFTITWVLCCGIAAIAGVLFGSLQTIQMSLISLGLTKALPAVLVGGMESLVGALCGGIIIGIAETLGGAYIDPYVGGGSKDIVPFLLMLTVLIVKPYGLFGLEEIERI